MSGREGTPRYRFHLAAPPSSADLTISGDLAHRITRVLRLSAGAELELFDGSGRLWRATLAAVEGRVVRLTLTGMETHDPEPPTVLLAALIKPNRFEWLLEKATELGVTAIRPVISARGAVRPAEVGRERLARWQRIAVEAAEQSGRSTVPRVAAPVPLAAALASATGALFVAAEPAHGAAPSLGEALTAAQLTAITLLTGPEGGFTAEEVQEAIEAGGQAVRLGSLVLRAETAAIAALAVVADARGRLSEPPRPASPTPHPSSPR